MGYCYIAGVEKIMFDAQAVLLSASWFSDAQFHGKCTDQHPQPGKGSVIESSITLRVLSRSQPQVRHKANRGEAEIKMHWSTLM